MVARLNQVTKYFSLYHTNVNISPILGLQSLKILLKPSLQSSSTIIMLAAKSLSTFFLWFYVLPFSFIQHNLLPTLKD